MAQAKRIFVCQNCGNTSSKWLGKCPACNEWNSFVEEVEEGKSKKQASAAISDSKVKPSAKQLNEISSKKENRIKTGIEEFDRVMGGGIVEGSVVLIGGEPGIGKSTLLLQIAVTLTKVKTLYVTGEESESQIKYRSNRLELNDHQCYVLSDTSLENILLQCEKVQPGLLVIDSIQTIYTDRIDSSAGSISQIRETTAMLSHYARKYSTAVLLIGHINKEGALAGPKVLEHMVDVVVQFEGDRQHLFRLIRSVKNRYGSTAEIGIFEMKTQGLVPVSDPSALLITDTDNGLSGVSIAASIEGIRPFMIEIQALVSSSVYPTPQRTSTGFDMRRLHMLLAVLEKRAGFQLASKDVFLNIAGGIRSEDPGIDLAVACAVMSSHLDAEIDKHITFAAEVGLTGEIRPVSRIEQRLKEAIRLGYKRFVLAKNHQRNIDKEFALKIQLIYASKLADVFSQVFRG